VKGIEGIYKVEMLGPYGWERFSTAFIQDGHYRGASAEHFSIGSYRVEGDNFDMVGNVTQYSENRSIFGKKGLGKLQIKFKGKVENDVIAGEASAVTDRKYTLSFRFNKLSALN
jgi:hypothetical protein